jgi:hypothetical protein
MKGLLTGAAIAVLMIDLASPAARAEPPIGSRLGDRTKMATCVADTRPAAVMALLGTQPFSDDENAAFAQLIGAMGPCLVAGTKLDAKREPLRAALAEALYQRAYHPEEESAVAPQAASKK